MKINKILTISLLFIAFSEQIQCMENPQEMLFRGAMNGDINLVNNALDRGVNIDAIDPNNGNTALMVAAQNGQEDIVKLLLENNASKDMLNVYGQTALTMAVENNHENIIKTLLNSGANPNIKENSGETALIIAAHIGNENIIRVLLNSGADPLTTDNLGRNALYVAIGKNFHAIAKILKDEKNNEELFNAIAHRDRHRSVRLIKKALNKGANINAIYHLNHDTPLTFAVKLNDADIVKLLLDRGADVTLINKEGKTALDIARERNLSEIAEILEKAQEKRRQSVEKEIYEQTPLLKELAKMVSEYECVECPKSGLRKVEE